jgi:hypothetical protein
MLMAELSLTNAISLSESGSNLSNSIPKLCLTRSVRESSFVLEHFQVVANLDQAVALIPIQVRRFSSARPFDSVEFWDFMLPNV